MIMLFDLTCAMQHYYTMNEFPATVEKKVKLLNYFRNYMKEHLLKAGANMEVKLVNLVESYGNISTTGS